MSGRLYSTGLFFALISSALPSLAVSDDQCTLLPLKMGSHNPGNPTVFQAPNKKFEIIFHKTDPKNKTSAESEDFEILNKKTKASCMNSAPDDTDVDISENERVIVAVSYGSANKSIDFIHPENCKRERQIVWTMGDVHFGGNLITIDAGCQCPSSEMCLCEPAQIYELTGESCQPKRLDKESRELTKTQLNVDISKPSYVTNPRKPDAKMIKEKP